MSASAYDSAMFRHLLQDRDSAILFTDTAELRAMLLVWGALAQAQAAEGLVPEVSARAIQRAAMEIQIDPAALSQATGQNGVVIPALFAAFQSEMKAPEHAKWVHFGATSQDIMDTAQALRLRQFLALTEARLRSVVATLAHLAHQHAETPMVGRSFGQSASVTTFGAVVAAWGWPLLQALTALPGLRQSVLVVSLGGAEGTLSIMQGRGEAVRAGLARGLGLNDPGRNWHCDRNGPAQLSAWATQVTGSLGKFGADLSLLAQTGIDELHLAQSSNSSTMPHKQNPVAPALLQAIAAHSNGLNGVMQGALVHQQQRDGAAWFAEWLSLPQICLGLGRALALAETLARTLQPDPARMFNHANDDTDLIHAEALVFALARRMPRSEAHSAVKDLCTTVSNTGTPLQVLARQTWPNLDHDAIFAMVLGDAPAQARAFASAALAT